MDEQKKIMFADVYKQISAMATMLKHMRKTQDELLLGTFDWDLTYKKTQDIVADAELITAACRSVYSAVNVFVENGPYMGGTARMTPLENMASN